MNQERKYSAIKEFNVATKRRKQFLAPILDLMSRNEMTDLSCIEDPNLPPFNSLEEKQCRESIIRMIRIGLNKMTIKGFLMRAIPPMYISPLGVCCLPDKTAIKEIVQLERKYNALVYAVIRTDTAIGTLDSLLYVCKTESEWPEDRMDIPNGIIMTYTVNQSEPAFSEFGSIGFEATCDGNLIRTA